MCYHQSWVKYFQLYLDTSTVTFQMYLDTSTFFQVLFDSTWIQVQLLFHCTYKYFASTFKYLLSLDEFSITYEYTHWSMKVHIWWPHVTFVHFYICFVIAADTNTTKTKIALIYWCLNLPGIPKAAMGKTDQ